MRGSSVLLARSREARLVEILHESATTRVFRDRGAAAAVVCKEPLGADAPLRLAHETSVLSRLESVQGVSRLAGGPPQPGALLMQDCGGVPLASHLRGKPLPLPMLLAVAQQMARILADVHRHGVVHRDIHPANILLDKNGDVVLVDFDLAILADAQASGVPDDGIVGTLRYMAPEQTGRTGRPVDARSDLYALGASLYEMATGRPPFETDDTLQLIHDHLVREPVSPSQVDAHVPQALSDIVMRLLAKAPDQRFQSAEGLLHDLVRLRDAIARGEDASFPLGERDFAARLAPPQRLVGRDTELGMLRAALAATRDTARHTVLIEGAPGVGKSALIAELKPLVAAAGGAFVYGKFDQYQHDAAASGAVAQALRALGRLLLAASREEVAAHRQRILDRLGRHAVLITRQLPEFALLLGALPELDEGGAEPGQAEQRLLQATVGLLEAIASAGRPLVIVLDDLQWAEIQSLRLFERLMHASELRGVLLVGAYRGQEINPAHALSPMLLDWKPQAGALLHLELQNLGAAGMSELIGEMLRLPSAQADTLAGDVGGLTAGNPFDTVEIVNTLRHEGVISLRAEGWHWDTAAIRRFVGRSSVIDLLSARIARLPAPSQLLVEYMSCLGGSVEHELLQVAAGLRPEELADQLRAPLEDGLLAADPSGQPTAHFRHDRVQQAVLGGLERTRRMQHHLAMARRLAQPQALHRFAAQQYLGCVDALSEPQEVREVARLFHDTALRLLKTAHAQQAERYLGAAGTLLDALGNAPGEAADATLRCRIDIAQHAVMYSLVRGAQGTGP